MCPPDNPPPAVLSATLEDLRAANEQLVLTMLRMRALEEERAKRDAELRTRIEDAVIETDEQHCITGWNPAATELYGWPPEEALGRPARTLLQPSTDACFSDTPLPRPAHWENVLTRRDGRKIAVAGTSIPLHDDMGAVRGTLTVSRDVTARKQIDELFQAREAQIEWHKTIEQEVGRLKSDFLMMMTHELRSPLNPLIGFTQMLLDHRLGDVPPKQADVLHLILSSATHLLKVIDEMLLVSSLEAGLVIVRKEAVVVAYEASEALQTHAETASAKGLATRVRCQGDTTIYTDPLRLRQILSRLIDNAIRFTDEGKVEISISTSEGLMEIRICDTGIGLSPHDLENLFTPFHQASSSTSRRYEGIGLSLFTCKRLAELLGGTLRAEGQIGHGSTFVLALPRALPPPEKPVEETAP